MTESNKETTPKELENLSPTIHTSKTFYEKLFEMANKSPFGAISSICALFIVIILSITVSLLFTNNKTSC